MQLVVLRFYASTLKSPFCWHRVNIEITILNKQIFDFYQSKNLFVDQLEAN